MFWELAAHLDKFDGTPLKIPALIPGQIILNSNSIVIRFFFNHFQNRKWIEIRIETKRDLFLVWHFVIQIFLSHKNLTDWWSDKAKMNPKENHEFSYFSNLSMFEGWIFLLSAKFNSFMLKSSLKKIFITYKKLNTMGINLFNLIFSSTKSLYLWLDYLLGWGLRNNFHSKLEKRQKWFNIISSITFQSLFSP
jgi:hypothetical protein